MHPPPQNGAYERIPCSIFMEAFCLVNKQFADSRSFNERFISQNPDRFGRRGNFAVEPLHESVGICMVTLAMNLRLADDIDQDTFASKSTEIRDRLACPEMSKPFDFLAEKLVSSNRRGDGI